jgi:hypothetical protein
MVGIGMVGMGWALAGQRTVWQQPAIVSEQRAPWALGLGLAPAGAGASEDGYIGSEAWCTAASKQLAAENGRLRGKGKEKKEGASC